MKRGGLERGERSFDDVFFNPPPALIIRAFLSPHTTLVSLFFSHERVDHVEIYRDGQTKKEKKQDKHARTS